MGRCFAWGVILGLAVEAAATVPGDHPEAITVRVLDGRSGVALGRVHVTLIAGYSPADLQRRMWVEETITDSEGRASIPSSLVHLPLLQVKVDKRRMCLGDARATPFSIDRIRNEGLNSPNHCGVFMADNVPGTFIVFAKSKDADRQQMPPARGVPATTEAAPSQPVPAATMRGAAGLATGTNAASGGTRAKPLAPVSDGVEGDVTSDIDTALAPVAVMVPAAPATVVSRVPAAPRVEQRSARSATRSRRAAGVRRSTGAKTAARRTARPGGSGAAAKTHRATTAGSGSGQATGKEEPAGKEHSSGKGPATGSGQNAGQGAATHSGQGSGQGAGQASGRGAEQGSTTGPAGSSKPAQANGAYDTRAAIPVPVTTPPARPAAEKAEDHAKPPAARRALAGPRRRARRKPARRPARPLAHPVAESLPGPRGVPIDPHEMSRWMQ